MNSTRKGNEYPIDKFEDNGFAFCSILSKSEASKALAAIQGFWSTDSGSLQVEGNCRFKTHLFLPEISEIVHHPALLEVVREALNTPHIALWSSDLNIKQPNSRQYFSAHQDATYTGLQPASKCITVWIALSDPVGVQEGCLSFLKGSHKRGQLPHVEEEQTTGPAGATDLDINMLSRGQRVLYEENEEGDEWIAIPLRAGEATCHSFYTIHKSGHNRNTQQPRVGLALRYMAANVRQMGPARELITWFDNEFQDPLENEKAKHEIEQHFDLEPRLPANPTQKELTIGRQAHEESMRRENSNYFQDSRVKGYKQ